MAFSLRSPTRFEELWPLLESSPAGSAMPIAGGTDLLFALTTGRWSPTVVVSLSKLPLRGIRAEKEEVRIGAGTPLRQVERDADVLRLLPALAEACADVGSVQLRHRATLAGNIVRGSPASDLLPPLIALDARLTLLSRKGRRTVPVEGFVRSSWVTGLAPGEIVEEVRIPAPRPSAYRWQRVRPANDISQVGVCAARHPGPTGRAGWRIVAGGTSPSVQRLTGAEACLLTESPSAAELEAAGRAAAKEAVFATDLRAAEDYRRKVLHVLVRRAVEGAALTTRSPKGGKR